MAEMAQHMVLGRGAGGGARRSLEKLWLLESDGLKSQIITL